MKLRNTTRKNTLANELRVYSTVFQKGLGLMFRLKPPEFSVVFPFNPARAAAIHMWFVFFSLDIAWLDHQGKILEHVTLKPWSFHTPHTKAAYVIELPAGTLTHKNVQVGDQTNIRAAVSKQD